MNPGVNPCPDGLFWTTRIPSGSVRANPGAGEAIYKVSNLQIYDFGNFGNALTCGSGVPATVSFEVRWSGVNDRLNIKNPTSSFGGEYVRGSAQMEWSAVVGPNLYQSDPIETSSSGFAELGTERNGAFFPRPVP